MSDEVEIQLRNARTGEIFTARVLPGRAYYSYDLFHWYEGDPPGDEDGPLVIDEPAPE